VTVPSRTQFSVVPTPSYRSVVGKVFALGIKHRLTGVRKTINKEYVMKLSLLALAATMAFATQSFAQDRGDFRNGGGGRGGGQACFYADADYRGQSFCLSPGQTYRNLDGFFNDKISSISVDGGVTVTMYSDADYRGRDMTINRDLSNMSDYPGWNDTVSSIVVDYDRGGGGGGRPGPGPGRPGPGRPGPGRPHR
jgi:hypothetical protein